MSSKIVGAAIASLFVAACGPSDDAGAKAGADQAAASPAPAEPGALPAVDEAALKARLTTDETLSILDFDRVAETTAQGAVSGFKAPVYAVPIAAGQTLTVDHLPPSGSVSYNIVDAKDASGTALFKSETQGNPAAVKAATNAVYLIKPFQPSEAARRGETADFTLIVGRK
jgi:hypothetical protein